MHGLIQRHRTLTIALYTDGVVPRNQIRPDKAGSFEAVRITVCEFPHWLRTRKGLRWIPICYPKHDDMHDHGVTISNIVIALLKSWFPSGASRSFEVGIFLRHAGRSETVHLKMRFGPMPQDADAFKHVFSLKGSSGQSPCPWCSNCMFRVPYFEDDSGFAHIHSPMHHKFTRHSNESFTIMLEDLETAEGATIAEHEKMSGLNYQPTELLWCHEVRRHLRFPYVIYWDHMHCLTASGGIAQYIVNQMVLRFCAARRMTICTKKPSFLYE